MAYFRKIEDKWRAEVERSGRRISKRFRTKREAELWAAQQESVIVGSGGTLYEHTVQDGIDRYLKDFTTAKATAQLERFWMAAFLRDFPDIAGMRLADVRTADLVRWRDARLRKVSPASVRSSDSVLKPSHAFQQAAMRRALAWHCASERCVAITPSNALATR